MTREQAKENLIALGVAEPTDEAVTNYLNTMQKEVKAAEDKATRYKADADRMKDLEKQLEEINNEKLTDAEKSAKAVEEANKQVMELQNTVKAMKLQASLAKIGIVGEDASGLVGEDGSLNTELLGNIIASREKVAVDAYKEQALNATPAPDAKKSEEKENPYKDIADRVAASKKVENEAVSIIDSYK